jgi:predicted transcriptional regulator
MYNEKDELRDLEGGLMTTLTLHLPDAVAERLQMLAELEGKDINNYAVAKLEAIATDEDDEEIDAELIATLQRANDSMDAGHFLTMDQVEANALAALAARHSKVAA